MFFVARAFVGSGGVHPTAGLTDYNLSEGLQRKSWLESAAAVYVLSDSSKLGVIAPFQIADTASLTAVITDDVEHSNVVEELRSGGVDVIVAPPFAETDEVRASTSRRRHAKTAK
jgi:DeoR/GlpR family transcriptional regulator of sugar metabolism